MMHLSPLASFLVYLVIATVTTCRLQVHLAQRMAVPAVAVILNAPVNVCLQRVGHRRCGLLNHNHKYFLQMYIPQGP